MSIIGKLTGALIGALFGPLGILVGVLLGHLADETWERTLGAGASGQGTLELVPLLFGLFGRVIGYSRGLTQAQSLFLQTAMIQQLQLLGSDQQLALRTFQAAHAVAGTLPLDEILEEVGSIAQEIESSFFLDRRTLHWIAATCRRLAALGTLRAGIVQILDLISDEFGILEEVGSAGTGSESRSYQSSHTGDSSYDQSWGGFRPSAAAGPDAYAVLGLTEAAGNDEIKKTYRNLVRQHHPDSHSHLTDDDPRKKKAAEKFLQVQQAYERIRKSRKF